MRWCYGISCANFLINYTSISMRQFRETLLAFYELNKPEHTLFLCKFNGISSLFFAVISKLQLHSHFQEVHEYYQHICEIIRKAKGLNSAVSTLVP